MKSALLKNRLNDIIKKYLDNALNYKVLKELERELFHEISISDVIEPGKRVIFKIIIDINDNKLLKFIPNNKYTKKLFDMIFKD